MQRRQRVAVYVLRRVDSSLQVLVFDHLEFPEAGTQIPAGGVEPGEDIEYAALREVMEETGLDQVQLLGKVGKQDRPHPHTGEERETTFFVAVTGSPQTEWEHLVIHNGDDAGLRFRCFFLPIDVAGSVLMDDQGEFLTLAARMLE